MDEALRARATDNLRRMRVDLESDWPTRLIADLARHDQRGPLTEVELMTLRCVSHGMTDQMAADSMNVSLETVKARLLNARRKLGAKNRTHSCALAIRRGLIS